MQAAAAAAAVAAVEDLLLGAEEAAARVQVVVVEGVHMIHSYRTALLTEENTVVVVSYQHLHNVVDCM
jgi:hypothetical protein